MRLHHDHDAEGPPCGFMEGALQRVADGTANPLVRLYALSHAARCGRCDRFLDRMRVTLGHLRATGNAESATPEAAAALDRLAAGGWQDETPRDAPGP